MDQELVFNITKKAKSNGGDKYTCTDDETFSIYFPQTISRTSQGDVKDTIIISIKN